MNTKSVLAKFQALTLGLMLMGAVQSCNKEADKVAPDADVLAQDCGTVTSPPPAPCKQVTLVAGQHTAVGTVSVAINSSGDALVTYAITTPGVYLSEVHLDLFKTLAQFRADRKLSNGGAIPGHFAFSKSWNAGSRITSYTVSVPAAYVNALNSNCFSIASHAALTNGETAWGGITTSTTRGVNLDPTHQFPGGNWSAYFDFCKTDCTPAAPTIDFTYAWEDLIGSANDSDYNDLVVQSDITKSATELKINFLLAARGASFDHKFQFNIPKTGITSITGAASYIDNGTYYTVTVFESDRAAFNGGYANVASNVPCVAAPQKTVTLGINSSFVYNAAKPYEPFITVYYAGDSNPAYSLYIYDVSHRDTWTSSAGKVYPNGIIIPADWRWPIEYTNITLPYPNFTSLTDGFTPTWANNLADPTKTFDNSACN
jgi:LruC domain-containing protein